MLFRSDYRSIADVVIHLKYTTVEGGDYLKQAASKAVSSQLEEISQALSESGLHVAFDMRHDLPNEWNMLKNTGAATIAINKVRLPYMAQLIEKTTIDSVMFLARTINSQNTFTIKVDDNSLDLQKISDELKLCRGVTEDVGLDKSFGLSIDAGQLPQLQDLILVVKYVVKNIA